jgi:hypothetical protein
MRSDGVLVGEIAHIEAAMPGGPRFRATMTNEERRAFANLLLICRTHHAIIDTDLESWTVGKLQALKASHEAIYTGAIDRLRSTVSDVTEGTGWQSATNLGRLPDVGDLNADEVAETIEVMNEYARRLAAVPVGARSVLALIVSRGKASEWPSRGTEVSILWPLLKQLANCPERELRDYIAILEEAELAWPWDPEDADAEIVAGNSTTGKGWPVLVELKQMAGSDSALIRGCLKTSTLPPSTASAARNSLSVAHRLACYVTVQARHPHRHLARWRERRS